jgi:UDP-glucose 4-epimerase
MEMVSQARGRGLPVIAIDDGSAGTWHRLSAFQDDAGVSCLKVDICDLQALSRAWPADGAADVVHLAARHFIPDCEASPLAARRVNVHGTANVLAMAEAHAARNFTLASTADVYRWGTEPHDERDAVRPSTVYGQTKVQAESLAADAARRSPGTRFLCARLFNLYGPDPTAPHLIPAIVKQAAAGGIVHAGNLDSVRDYVYVEDAARALDELLSGDARGTVNVGTGTGTDGHAVVRIIGQILGRELTVLADAARLRTADRPALVASPGRLSALVPWWPATSLEEGLARILERESTGFREASLPGVDEQSAGVVPRGRAERGGALR